MKNNMIIYILVLATAVLAVFMNKGIFIVDAQTSNQTFTSNVSIVKQVGIVISTNFSDGILFGSLNPGTDLNPDPGMWIDTNTSNNITATASNNVAIQICIKDNANLSHTDLTTNISNANYYWRNSSNATNISLPGVLPMTGDYVVGNGSIGAGGIVYYGFWLTVPSAQKGGDYNNSVLIQAREELTTCA